MSKCIGEASHIGYVHKKRHHRFVWGGVVGGRGGGVGSCDVFFKTSREKLIFFFKSINILESSLQYIRTKQLDRKTSL